MKKVEEYKSANSIAAKLSGGEYTELKDIRQDIESLRDNVLALTTHLKKDGKAQFKDVKGYVRDGVDTLRHKGEDTLETVTEQIKENPSRAVLIAFATGLVASLLLRRG